MHEGLRKLHALTERLIAQDKVMGVRLSQSPRELLHPSMEVAKRNGWQGIFCGLLALRRKWERRIDAEVESSS